MGLLKLRVLTALTRFAKTYRFQLFTLFLIVLVLGCIELYFYFKFQAEYGRFGYTISHLAKGRVQDSPFAVYESVPNSINLKAGWRQNNVGFRTEEDVTGQKSPDEFRIFLLGGSAAHGEGAMQGFLSISGVDEYPTDKTLTSHLERMLQKKFPTKKIRAYNAAVSGYTLSMQIGQYVSVLRQLKPDLLILLDGHNDIFFDITDPNYSRWSADRYAWSVHPYKTNTRYKLGMWLMSKSYTFFYIGKLMFVSREKYDADVYRQWLNTPMTPDTATLLKRFAKFEKNIRREVGEIIKRYAMMKALADVDSVRILFAPQPLLTLKPKKSDVEKACYHYLLSLDRAPHGRFFVYEYYLREYERWATANGLPFINVQEAVNKTSEQIFIDYCHFSFGGNAFIASLLADKIEACDFIH